MNTSPKILVIRLSSLGDVLHTLPAFADLRASYPAAKIDWLVGPKARLLLTAVPGIDAIHLLDMSGVRSSPYQWSAWRQIWSMIRKLRAQKYDYVCDFQGLLKTAFIAFASGSNERLGFSRDLVREPPAQWFYHRTVPKPSRQLHVVALNQLLTEMIGARSGSLNVNLLASDEDVRHIDFLIEKEKLTDFVIINPGGGWPTKMWKPERYGALAARIRTDLDLQVAVTTGPGEDELYETIAANCPQTPPCHFQISFLQLIPLLMKTRLLIGGDTGPFHLACALGTPVVGIMGPTAPIRNGPWRDVDEVVMHRLPCSYCHKRTCPTNNECMDITVDEVFAAVIRRLKSNRGAVNKAGGAGPE